MRHEDDRNETQGLLDGRPLSRREFIKFAGMAGVVIGAGGSLGGLLAACGGSSTTTTAPSAARSATVSTTAATTASSGVASGSLVSTRPPTIRGWDESRGRSGSAAAARRRRRGDFSRAHQLSSTGGGTVSRTGCSPP